MSKTELASYLVAFSAMVWMLWLAFELSGMRSK